MFKQFSIFALLLCAFIGASAEAATSVNGVWSASNGDLLFLVKSTKGIVVAVDMKPDKTVRYLFEGAMSGEHLSLQNRDATASLEADVSGDSLTGNLTEASGTTDITASHSFYYKGSAYDGFWQLDGTTSYYVFATLTLEGVATVIVPYFTVVDQQVTEYNLFMGTPAKTNDDGTGNFAGVSLLDTTALKLGFTSNSAANVSFIKNKQTTKFTATRKYAVTKKSGQP
ncbi:hypothetical protein [Methylomagnum sp.]